MSRPTLMTFALLLVSLPAVAREPCADVPAEPAEPLVQAISDLPDCPGTVGPRTWSGTELTPELFVATARALDLLFDRELVGDRKLQQLLETEKPRKREERFRHRRRDMREKLLELREEFDDLAEDRASEEFREKFGGFEVGVRARGFASAREFFNLAIHGGMRQVAARLGVIEDEELQARYHRLYELVEQISDVQFEARIAIAFNDTSFDGDERKRRIADLYEDTVGVLRTRLDDMFHACEISDEERRQAYAYGVRRLVSVRRDEIYQGFPTGLGVPFGTPEWDEMLTQIAGEERGNQSMEFIVDPGQYYDRLIDIIDRAGPVLGISMMRLEPDPWSLPITDALTLVPRLGGPGPTEGPTAQNIVDRLAAKQLEMDYSEYARLRHGLDGGRSHSAREIARLRLAQSALAVDGNEPSIDSPSVMSHAEDVIAGLGDDALKQRVREVFDRTDVRLIRDGKLIDLGYAGRIFGLASKALNPLGWLRGLIAPPTRADAAYLGLVAANDAEPHRHALNMVGSRLADVEDTVHFVAQPKRSIEGPGRDLIDIGVPVVSSNRIISKSFWRNWRQLLHEKAICTITEDGLGLAMATGNNIGAKHFPREDDDGNVRYLWHDGGYFVEGGTGSIVNDQCQYFAELFNELADPEDQIADVDAWKSQAMGVGSDRARFVNIEPWDHRAATTVTMTSLASMDKFILTDMIFFSGDGFKRQFLETGKRWLEEGWDPSCRFDPENPDDPEWWSDPSCRMIGVIGSGWIDGGWEQFGNWAYTHELNQHGIDVMLFRPGADQPTIDREATYDPAMMNHTKYLIGLNHDRTGMFSTGSLNFQNPVFWGWYREINTYTEDARLVDRALHDIVVPDLQRAVSARQAPFLIHPINRAILLGTKPFQ